MACPFNKQLGQQRHRWSAGRESHCWPWSHAAIAALKLTTSGVRLRWACLASPSQQMSCQTNKFTNWQGRFPEEQSTFAHLEWHLAENNKGGRNVDVNLQNCTTLIGERITFDENFIHWLNNRTFSRKWMDHAPTEPAWFLHAFFLPKIAAQEARTAEPRRAPTARPRHRRWWQHSKWPRPGIRRRRQRKGRPKLLPRYLPWCKQQNMDSNGYWKSSRVIYLQLVDVSSWFSNGQWWCSLWRWMFF